MQLNSKQITLPADSGEPRSDTLHLSDVINSIMQTLNMEQYPESDDATREGYFEQGFIWERLLSRAFADRVGTRPGEITLDGITGSPDALLYTEAGLIVEEYKCTKASSNLNLSSKHRWMMQIKGYCWMMETTDARFYILHLNGDYRENRNPRVMQHDIRFPVSELRDNWNAITSHAQEKGWIQ